MNKAGQIIRQIVLATFIPNVIFAVYCLGIWVNKDYPLTVNMKIADEAIYFLFFIFVIYFGFVSYIVMGLNLLSKRNRWVEELRLALKNKLPHSSWKLYVIWSIVTISFLWFGTAYLLTHANAIYALLLEFGSIGTLLGTVLSVFSAFGILFNLFGTEEQKKNDASVEGDTPVEQ